MSFEHPLIISSEGDILKTNIEMALLANTVVFDSFGFYVPGTLWAKRQQSLVRKYPNWSAKQIVNYNFV